MRRVQVWSDSRRIARSVTASANQDGYMLAGKAEQATQSIAWSEGNLASGGLDTVPAEKLQEVLWKQFFADTAEWWDYRRHKPAPQHPDFRHKECKVPLWLNNRHKPHWVDSQLAMLDASLRTGVTLAEGPVGVTAAEGRLDAEMPRKGRLKEAMLVFSKVSRPNAYNWATIIFAYARHGEADEAAEAVRLYRQMCESTTIRPDDCLYSAVLKACATAKDLITGKEGTPSKGWVTKRSVFIAECSKRASQPIPSRTSACCRHVRV